MKLSKAQIQAHKQAMDLVESDRKLTEDECLFIIENFQEGATNINSAIGAFFTPTDLAINFAFELPHHARIVDLCAGIGALAYFAYHYTEAQEITCVELNPEYVKVGKRILPEANWIVGDALTFVPENGSIFDIAIANPPFGNIKTSNLSGKYTGAKFEFKIIEHASQIAKHGVFLLPQNSVGYKFSGVQSYSEAPTPELEKFKKLTSIHLEASSVDTSEYRDQWKGTKQICEIVSCTFGKAVPVQEFQLAG